MDIAIPVFVRDRLGDLLLEVDVATAANEGLTAVNEGLVVENGRLTKENAVLRAQLTEWTNGPKAATPEPDADSPADAATPGLVAADAAVLDGVVAS